jgi:hypothetical protein
MMLNTLMLYCLLIVYFVLLAVQTAFAIMHAEPDTRVKSFQ